MNRIQEIIANGMKPKQSRFSPVGGPRGPRQPVHPGPRFETPPPPIINQPPMPVFEEKLLIGLEHAPPNFEVKNKLTGPGVCYTIYVYQVPLFPDLPRHAQAGSRRKMTEKMLTGK